MDLILLTTSTLQAENFISLFRVIGIAAAALAILSLFRLAALQNNLPLKKAKQFLQDSGRPHIHEEEEIPPQLAVEEIIPAKTKKQLLAYSIAPDAQNLLAKFSVQPKEDNGWVVSHQ